MQPLCRNRLVWLHAAGWRRLLDAYPLPDDDAREVLAHWAARDLPLVVARPSVPLAPGCVALGLPAPLRWGRRRLALQAPRADLVREASFPSLADVAHHLGREDLAGLARALDALGVRATVFGSHGWALLTGQAYLRPGSDLDLDLAVPGFDALRAALPLLLAAPAAPRLDGEFMLREGSAATWRECAALLAGEVREVLVKRLEGVELVGLEELRRRAEGDPFHPEAATAALCVVMPAQTHGGRGSGWPRQPEG